MFCPCNVGKLLGLQAMGSIDERKVGSTLEMVLMIRFLLYCSLSCDRSHSNDILDGTRFRHSFVITSQLTSLPQTWSVSSEKNLTKALFRASKKPEPGARQQQKCQG